MGWKTRNLTQELNAPLATFSPSSYLFAQFTRHVVYQGFTPDVGSTGIIYELYYSDDGAWHTNNLNDAAGGAPAATSFPTAFIYATLGSQHVLYIGALFDGHVHELWWDGDWHHHDLMSDTTFPLALSEPRGFEDYGAGTENVVYQGQDNHVHLLTNRVGGNGWQHTDLTDSVGGPLAAGAPGAYTFEAQHTEHVNYRSADGHINEYWKDNTGWHFNDLTARSGAPFASDDGHTGYVFTDQLTQHVNFSSDADGHVHELWWEASGWSHVDLTQLTGAPLIASGFHPSGYAFESQGLQPVATQHVLYTGRDGGIHELWWDPSGWHHNPIGPLVGAPASISNPTGFVEVDIATQNVYYNSDAHQIIELRWEP